MLDLTVAMTKTPPGVTDDLFEELRRHFSSAQLVELVTEISQANFRGRFNRAFHCLPAGFSKGAFCPMPEQDREQRS